MLRFMEIIIEYLETTLFQSRYAKIDSNYHRLSYPTVGYRDRLKRTTA